LQRFGVDDDPLKQRRGARTFSSDASDASDITLSSASGDADQSPRPNVSKREPGKIKARRLAGAAASAREGFVDARKLESEDLVAKALRETAGPLGVASRPKVVDFNARLKERRRANTRMFAARIAIGAAVLAVVFGFIWLLLFSNVFRLDSAKITVTGANEWVGEQRVHDLAAKQAGKSLFLVSGNDVIAQLKAIPGVSDATASKKFPQGLAVTVTAQRPAAMLKTADSLVAVDAKGRVLNSVNGASAEGIPVIEVDNVDQGLRDRAVRQAVKILSALPDQMRQSITKVSAQTQDSITTELNGGDRVIIWGDAAQLELKKAVVDKIINDPTKIGDKHHVDVSAPLRPIIK
jgi:cell division protein FtsQ